MEVWAVGRQVAQACAGGFDGLSDAMDFVGRQIVHDDDLAGPQLGDERLFDIGEKRPRRSSGHPGPWARRCRPGAALR